MKEHFNKELVKTKEDNRHFKNSTKCWISDNDYVIPPEQIEILRMKIVISILN